MARLTWEARCLDKKLEPVFEAEEMEEAAGWQRDAVASGTQHLATDVRSLWATKLFVLRSDV